MGGCLGACMGAWVCLCLRAEGPVTHRQRSGCLAHRKMQNGWVLNLNPTIDPKPCVPQAGQGIYRAPLSGSSVEGGPWCSLPPPSCGCNCTSHTFVPQGLKEHHGPQAVAPASVHRHTAVHCGPLASPSVHHRPVLRAVHIGSSFCSLSHCCGQWTVVAPALCCHTAHLTALQGAVGSGASAVHCCTAGGRGQWGA